MTGLGLLSRSLTNPLLYQIMPALESLGKGKQGTSILILGCMKKKKGAQKRLDHTCSLPSNTNLFLTLGRSEWVNRKKPGNFLSYSSFLLGRHFLPSLEIWRERSRAPPHMSEFFRSPNRLEYIVNQRCAVPLGKAISCLSGRRAPTFRSLPQSPSDNYCFFMNIPENTGWTFE